jgi:succinate dehydrogenase/fumarate reductase flavoprotein subunit
MERYSPTLKSNIDYYYLTRAMALEARQGRAPFYFDHTTMKPDDLAAYKDRTGWMATNIERLGEAGIKAIDEPQEWMPSILKVMGIKTDSQMQTIVPGLFAGGRIRSLDPGIRVGGWALCTAVAFGYWAGESAGKFARSCEAARIDSDDVGAFKNDLYAPLGKVGKEPKDILLELQKILFQVDVLILKNESALKRTLSDIEAIRDNLLPQMGARDLHYLMNLREVMNMTLIAELQVRASLARMESRASHYREDYPSRDDASWLKWNIVRLKDGKLNSYSEPVPLDRYKIKPSRYYMNNFKFPT